MNELARGNSSLLAFGHLTLTIGIKKKNMTFEDRLSPGELIVTSMGAYEHMSIVSDRRCALGKPMLISATKRTNTVLEESYDLVVRGRKTGRAPRQSELPAHAVLEKARSQIRRWEYDPLVRNCEMFANWAAGHKVSSRQVNGAVFGALAGMTATGIIAKNASLPQLAFIALVGGAVGLAATQVLK